jgi:hypothetical protein
VNEISKRSLLHLRYILNCSIEEEQKAECGDSDLDNMLLSSERNAISSCSDHLISVNSQLSHHFIERRAVYVILDCKFSNEIPFYTYMEDGQEKRVFTGTPDENARKLVADLFKSLDSDDHFGLYSLKSSNSATQTTLTPPISMQLERKGLNEQVKKAYINRLYKKKEPSDIEIYSK